MWPRLFSRGRHFGHRGFLRSTIADPHASPGCVVSRTEAVSEEESVWYFAKIPRYFSAAVVIAAISLNENVALRSKLLRSEAISSALSPPFADALRCTFTQFENLSA
jgi:hypothetical protein